MKLRTARRAKAEANGKCEGRKSYSEAAPELVAKIKALYRKPRKGERKTLQQIADQLNAKEAFTLDGKPWTKHNLHRVLKSLGK